MQKKIVNERQIIGFVILVFVGIAVVTILSTTLSVKKIERQLGVSPHLYADDLVKLHILNDLLTEAVQESLAYLLSGEAIEKQEFMELSQNFKDQSRELEATLFDASRAGDRERIIFEQIADRQSTLVAAATRLFKEYETGGKITHTTFSDYEATIDEIGLLMDSLLKIKSDTVVTDQETLMTTIVQARARISQQGVLIVLAALVSAMLVVNVLRRVFSSNRQARDAVAAQQNLADAADVGILVADALAPDLPVIYTNPGFATITGYDNDSIIGRNCRILQGKATNDADVTKIRNSMQQQKAVRVVIGNYRRNGEFFWNNLSISPVRDGSGKVTHYVGVINDVTEQKSVEQQLIQAQKMEAIGHLAGGIAHDFNNHLTVISGAAEMLSLQGNSEVVHWTDKIMDAAGRSAALTRQLLTFARKQVLEPKRLNLNQVIAGIQPLLKQTIEEHVLLEFSLADDLNIVSMDPSQMEQVITNLVLNSRDAMPDGGTIRITTANVSLSEQYSNMHTGVRPGPYVMLEVSDTGIGIDPIIQDRIFEPFVSTKDVGHGTGVGLATVYGIVKQCAGTIDVDSKPGHGTTIKIYFPKDESGAIAHAEPEAAYEFRGNGTVLLVEDNESVRATAKAMLEAIGFDVIEAVDGVNAIKMLETRSDFALILTDVTMPNMGGLELADHANLLHPDIKVLFMSGYSQDGFKRPGKEDQPVTLLQKPFTRNELCNKLQAVLS